MIAVAVFGVIAIGLWILTYVARAAFRSTHRNDQTFIMIPILATVSSAIAIGSAINTYGYRDEVFPVLLVILGLVTLTPVALYLIGLVRLKPKVQSLSEARHTKTVDRSSADG